MGRVSSAILSVEFWSNVYRVLYPFFLCCAYFLVYGIGCENIVYFFYSERTALAVLLKNIDYLTK